jgi:hypothetical protein
MDVMEKHTSSNTPPRKCSSANTDAPPGIEAFRPSLKGTLEESNLVAAFKSSNPLPEIAARAAVARQRREPVDHQ